MQRPSANLSDQEIQDICEGLTQKAAQRRHLESLGLIVKPKPNGKPLVSREEWARVMSGSAQSNEAKPEQAAPDRAALLGFMGRKNKNGTSAQR